jgi:hypothetical protein
MATLEPLTVSTMKNLSWRTTALQIYFLTVLLIWVTNIKKLKEIKHKDILDTN